MTKPVVIFLCGPPGSGKDTAGNILQRAYCNTPWNPYLFKLSHGLKAAVHELLGLPYTAREGERTMLGFKDQPRAEFFGLTPRQVYIALSENFAKPLFGNSCFGVIAARQLRGKTQTHTYRMHVITDSGFAHEAEPIIKEFGVKQCLLVHLSRDGTSFDNDSRSYWELPKLTTIAIANNYPLDWFTEKLKHEVDAWLATLPN